MKDRKIVGEGIVKEPVRKYEGEETSPVTGKPYEGVIIFEPSSVRCYRQPLPLDFVGQIMGKKLIPRFIINLTWEDYGKILAEVVKAGFY